MVSLGVSDYVNADDQLRMIARVASLYHEQGLRQAQIAERLHISQPRVSRLLKRAVQLGIVRTTVVVPGGIYTSLEEALEEKFGLSQVVVVADSADGYSSLGPATADFLSATLTGGDSIGISSWSATLLDAVNAMRPFRTPVATEVVQLVGGLGDPRVQMQATRLVGQLAAITGAQPVLLPAPGVLGSSSGVNSLLNDPAVAEAVEAWANLTVALVGIGGMEPSDLARSSGNAFPNEERLALEAEGAVGDICFRFYNADGVPVSPEFDDRVVGIRPEQLLRVPRRIGVAGGAAKFRAIRGALVGEWINVLITDHWTATQLLETD